MWSLPSFLRPVPHAGGLTQCPGFIIGTPPLQPDTAIRSSEYCTRKLHLMYLPKCANVYPCDQTHEKNNLEAEGFILPHVFRAVSPWLAISIAFRSVGHWGMTEKGVFSSPILLIPLCFVLPWVGQPSPIMLFHHASSAFESADHGLTPWARINLSSFKLWMLRILS